MALVKTRASYPWGDDFKSIRFYLDQLVIDVRDDFFKIYPSIYTTLPTATKEMRGLFAIKEAAATDDKLYFCIKNAAGGYEWQLVTFT